MDSATQSLIREAFTGSSEGRLHFGQVLGLLAQAGVESYAVDYRTHLTTYFLPDGQTLGIETEMPEGRIGDAFDAEALQSAIRGSQKGEVKYPEFKRLSSQAGCVGYTVWLAGRHVAYYGRKGESHVERFPS
jgi:uncharacterized protein YbcV (DUF1398 family)